MKESKKDTAEEIKRQIGENDKNVPGKSQNAQNTPQGWEPPVTFDTVNVPAFPIECLPTPLKEYALAVSKSIQTPVDMAAVELLAAMAVCVQGKYKIKVKPDWYEPLNLYCLMIADSGEKKSVVLREVIRPICQYEFEYNEANKEEIAQNHKERDMLMRELEDLTNRATKNSRKPVSKEEVFAKQKELNNFEIKREC